jgi:hypothetical protein
MNRRLLIFFGLGVSVALAAGWGAFPRALYKRQSQPLVFPHKTHAEKSALGCESCHEVRADGTFSGVPKIEVCAPCHSEVQGKSAAEATLVNEYIKLGREVPWLVYSRQPMNVFFSHAMHAQRGKMACSVCHGDIGDTDVLPVYEENRLTGYSRDIWGRAISGLGNKPGSGMKMSDCESCHRERSVQAGCLGCHQ